MSATGPTTVTGRTTAAPPRGRRARWPIEVHAIIPGRVVALSVRPGDLVVAGEQMLVVEAMRVRNELRSPRDGTIDHVGVSGAQTTEVGDLLVVIS